MHAPLLDLLCEVGQCRNFAASILTNSLFGPTLKGLGQRYFTHSIVIVTYCCLGLPSASLGWSVGCHQSNQQYISPEYISTHRLTSFYSQMSEILMNLIPNVPRRSKFLMHTLDSSDSLLDEKGWAAAIYIYFSASPDAKSASQAAFTLLL